MIENIQALLKYGRPDVPEVRETNILKDQKDDQDNKRFGRNSAHDSETAEDLETTYIDVSVLSAILYLESVLEERLSPDISNMHSGKSDFKGWTPSDTANRDVLHKAASAYAHSAEVVHTVPAPTKPDKNASLKEMYDLIKDLRLLRDGGVDILQVEGNQSFIGGIRQAVGHKMMENQFKRNA